MSNVLDRINYQINRVGRVDFSGLYLIKDENREDSGKNGKTYRYTYSELEQNTNIISYKIQRDAEINTTHYQIMSILNFINHIRKKYR